MSNMIFVISVTFMYAAPLMFAALGGVISEKAGVVNIGIEGMMTLGAFVGAAVGYYSQNPWLALLCAALAGGILSVLHALASVKFKADQTISGMALNMIGPGLALFLARIFFDGASQTLPVPNKLPKVISNASGSVSFDSSSLLALLFVFLIWVFLYKTKGGLRLMAVGEHPAAADSLGINVNATRYAAVVASGILSGIGGATMSLAVVSSFSQTVISGQGYIALAAVIFGRWNPVGAALACLLFGFFQALVVVLGGSSIQIPSQILAMLPYVVTIIVLVLMRGQNNAPKADGIPYEK